VGLVEQVGHVASMRVCSVPPRFSMAGQSGTNPQSGTEVRRGPALCPTVSHLYLPVAGRLNQHGYWLSHLSHLYHCFLIGLI